MTENRAKAILATAINLADTDPELVRVGLEANTLMRKAVALGAKSLSADDFVRIMTASFMSSMNAAVTDDSRMALMRRVIELITGIMSDLDSLDAARAEWDRLERQKT